MTKKKGGRPKTYATLLERLEANSTTLPWTGCYIFLGHVSGFGHGRVSVRINGQHKNLLVHRAAYSEYYGVKLSKRTVLRHTCHIPSCWNPLHLLKSSQSKNIQDQLERGSHLSQHLHNYHENCYWCNRIRRGDRKQGSLRTEELADETESQSN